MIDKKTLWEMIKPFVYSTISSIVMSECAYEPNNSSTWKRVSDKVSELTGSLITLYYLNSIKIVCDETVNTDEVIKANEFHLKFCYKVLEKDEWAITDFFIKPNIGCLYSEDVLPVEGANDGQNS